MRIYSNWKEAYGEIKRDIVEMGILVHPRSMQDKVIADDPDYETFELQNYIYTVTDPLSEGLEPVLPWAELEWRERVEGIDGTPINPGVAWEARADVWKEFLHPGPNGRMEFAYTYAERFAKYGQVHKVLTALDADHNSRQAFISVWDPSDVDYLGGQSRVPCTLGYYLQVRKGKLNLTYLMRSCDFITHFQNDAYLAVSLQAYACGALAIPMGHFTHWMGSLHMYRKDAKDVF